MLFDQLSSDIIKTGLIAKLQFSLGYNMIAKHIKAQGKPAIDIETGKETNQYNTEAQHAKAKFRCFQDYCHTNGYLIASLEEILRSYVNSSNRPILNTPTDIIALRAKVAGGNAAKFQERADKQANIQRGRLEEKLRNLTTELAEVEHTATDWSETETVDEADIILDTWIIENYPKVVKSQVAYWTRFNNWDDAELILINADNEILEASKV